MGRGIFKKEYCLSEYNFQVVNTHGGATNNVRIRTGAGVSEIELKGSLFRKTSTTGSEVTMLVELFELATPSTGGAVYEKFLAVKMDRESKRDLPFAVSENVTFSSNPSGIMLRERGIASRTAVSRDTNIALKYSLKPNTDYVFVSTVTGGGDNNVESTIYGVIREVE